MNFAKLDAFLADMPHRGYPACELAITKDGKTVYHKAIGHSDAALTKPAAPGDLYWIYSCTKVITCIAAMRLVEEGKIALDDPVSKYLPEYENLMIKQADGTLVPAQNTMTILHLFTMTGGKTHEITDTIKAAYAPDATTLDIVRAMAKDPLIFEPGTHYRYSLCHDVLGAVIEVASGMRLSEYMQKFIFAPLGIKEMGFRPTPEQLARFSAMYTIKGSAHTPVERTCENVLAFTPQYDSGGAGLLSTVEEYLKIITVIACGGTTADGYTLLKPETIRMMQENRLPPAALNDFVTTRHFGYGWGLCGRVHIDPIRSLSLSPVGEFGWSGATGSFSMIDPDNHVALFFATHLFGCTYGYHMIQPTLRNLTYECLRIE